MAPSFPLSVRIIQLCPAPPRREERVCVIFPAWAHRVTAPILPRRGIDLFERVVLGLCQAGIREPDRIAARINLHARLCSHIIDQAIYHRLLDRQRELTEEGRRALRTGSVAEETSWSVRYVLQSPETGGDLWPRTAERLVDAHVIWRAPGKARLQLGTPGRPDSAEAMIIGMPAGNQGAAAPRVPALSRSSRWPGWTAMPGRPHGCESSSVGKDWRTRLSRARSPRRWARGQGRTRAGRRS